MAAGGGGRKGARLGTMTLDEVMAMGAPFDPLGGGTSSGGGATASWDEGDPNNPAVLTMDESGLPSFNAAAYAKLDPAGKERANRNLREMQGQVDWEQRGYDQAAADVPFGALGRGVKQGFTAIGANMLDAGARLMGDTEKANEIRQEEARQQQGLASQAKGFWGQAAQGAVGNVTQYAAMTMAGGLPAYAANAFYGGGTRALSETGDKSYAATQAVLQGLESIIFAKIGLGGATVPKTAWEGVKTLAGRTLVDVGADVSSEFVQAVSAKLEGIDPDALAKFPERGLMAAAQSLLAVGMGRVAKTIASRENWRNALNPEVFIFEPSRKNAERAGLSGLVRTHKQRQDLADGALVEFATGKTTTDWVRTNAPPTDRVDATVEDVGVEPAPTVAPEAPVELDANDEKILGALKKRLTRKLREAGFNNEQMAGPLDTLDQWYRTQGYKRFRPGVTTEGVTTNAPEPAENRPTSDGTAPPNAPETDTGPTRPVDERAPGMAPESPEAAAATPDASGASADTEQPNSGKPYVPSGREAAFVPKSVLQFNALADSVGSAATKGVRWLKQNFLSGGEQNEETRKMVFRRDGVIRGHMAEIAQNNRDLLREAKKAFGVPLHKQLPDTVAEHLNEALHDPAVAATLAPDLAVVVQKMRDHIDGLSTQIQALGDTTAEMFLTIDKNKGVYITRTYKKFKNPEGWRRKALKDPQIMADFAAEVRQTSPQATMQDITQLAEILLRRQTMQNGDLTATGSRTNSYVNILKKRKDLSAAIRQLYGEEKNAFNNYAESIGQMSNLVAHKGFVENLKSEGLAQGFFSDVNNPQPGHVQEVAHDQHRQLEGLKGVLMEPELASALNELYAMRGVHGGLRALAGASSTVKAFKTVFSFPKSWVRNFLGNPAISVANGHWGFQNLADFGKGFKNTFWDDILNQASPTGKAAMRRLKELGIIEGVHLEALKDAAQHASVAVNDYIAGIDSRNPLKRVAKGFGKGYQSMDTIWKIHNYLGELRVLQEAHPNANPALLEEQAARQTRAITPTYSEASKAAKNWSRYMPLGPFSMFNSEIIRTTGNRAALIARELASGNPVLRRQAAMRLAGQSAALAGIAGVAQVVNHLWSGLTDEQEEAMRDRLAPWQRNSQIAVVSTDKDGQPKGYFDLGFNDPFGVITKPAEALIRGKPGEAVGEIAAPFVGEDIFVGTLLSMKRNRDENGLPVWDEGASPFEQNKQLMAFALKRLEPGTLTAAGRIKDAAQGKTTKSGTPLSLTNELTSTFMGARKETFDRETSDYYRNREFNRKAQASSDFIRRLFMGKGSFDAEAVRASYTDAEATRRQTIEQWRKYVDGSIVLGEKEPYAKVVRDVGAASTLVRMMYAKQYLPYHFRPADLRKMLTLPDGQARVDLYRELLQSGQ
jgi:hypothetical protein